MKLCAIQMPFAYQSEERAEYSVEFAIQELQKCDSSCDLILTPEYANAPASFPAGRCIPFAEAHTERLLTAAAESARRCHSIVAVNHVSEFKPGLFRNTTSVFDRNGHIVGRYYKQHLPRSEREVNRLDDSYTRSFRCPEIIEVDGLRLGFLICYDTYFSEYVAHLAYRHPDIVLVSSFQRAERPEIIRMQNQHLAFTCNSFVLRASVSMGSDARTGGCTLAVSPEGNIIGEFGNSIGTFSCEIGDPHHKYMRSNSYGGALIPNDQFIEQGRTPWCYRPCGSMVIESESVYPYPRVCAHRGFSTVAPENSLPAFGAAISLGAPEIELDIQFSKDGIPVICHDDELSRVSDGDGLIKEKNIAELRKIDFGQKFNSRFTGLKIALFEEFLAKFSRHVIINLHLKTTEKEGEEYSPVQFRKIQELLARYDALRHVYLMGDRGVMACGLRMAPEIPRCMGAFPDPWHIVERAVELKCSKVQLFAPYYNQKMIDNAHAHGIRCNFFCCDDPVEAKKLFAQGIDTILSNDYWTVARALQEFQIENVEK